MPLSQILFFLSALIGICTSSVTMRRVSGPLMVGNKTNESSLPNILTNSQQQRRTKVIRRRHKIRKSPDDMPKAAGSSLPDSIEESSKVHRSIEKQRRRLRSENSDLYRYQPPNHYGPPRSHENENQLNFDPQFGNNGFFGNNNNGNGDFASISTLPFVPFVPVGNMGPRNQFNSIGNSFGFVGPPNTNTNGNMPQRAGPDSRRNSMGSTSSSNSMSGSNPNSRGGSSSSMGTTSNSIMPLPPPPPPPDTNFSAVGLLGFLSFLALMQNVMHDTLSTTTKKSIEDSGGEPFPRRRGKRSAGEILTLDDKGQLMENTLPSFVILAHFHRTDPKNCALIKKHYCKIYRYIEKKFHFPPYMIIYILRKAMDTMMTTDNNTQRSYLGTSQFGTCNPKKFKICTASE